MSLKYTSVLDASDPGVLGYPSPKQVAFGTIIDPQNPDTAIQPFQNGTLTEEEPYNADESIKFIFCAAPQVLYYL